MAINTSQREEIYASIKRQIEDAKLEEGARMPSAETLCKNFRTSRNTIFEILRRLDKEGLIERKSGALPIVVGPAGNKRKAAKMPAKFGFEKFKAGRIAETIVEEIQDGKLRVGDMLPSQKVLRFKFGTSKSTMAKAIQLVMKKQLLYREGPNIRVGLPRTQSSVKGNYINLYAGRFLLSPAGPTSHFGAFLKSFENELTNHGISVAKNLDWQQEFSMLSHTPKDDDALGLAFILQPPLARKIDRESRFHPLSTPPRFLQFEKPAVFYSRGKVFFKTKHLKFKATENLGILESDDVLAGEEIACFLASMGHRHIGFLYYDEEVWNKSRLEGVQQGIHNALEGQGSVSVFSSHMDKNSLRTDIALNSDQCFRTVDRAVSQLFKKERFSQAHSYHRITREMFATVIVDDETQRLKPCFEEAFARKEITAWICADSLVALAADAFLAERGIQPPQRISLAAIDDNQALLARGITAYDFQAERIGYLAAHWILRDIPIKRDKKGVVIPPGRVIDRGTVGRAAP